MPDKYHSYKIVLIAILSTCLTLTSLEAQKKETEDNYKKAVKYFFQSKFEMAELLFQEELKKNPENGMAYSYLGDIYLRKKRYDGALNLYKKAVDLNPGSAEDYFRIGQVYYLKGMGPAALENFKKSLEMNKNLKYAYYHMGLTYLMILRDKQNTILSWEDYLRAAPEDPQYDKIRRAIELLKDPNFQLPPLGSDVPIEEALHLGGMVLKDQVRKAEEKKAGHAEKKTKDKIEDIYRDDDL